jgi:hypothetical protein
MATGDPFGNPLSLSGRRRTPDLLSEEDQSSFWDNLAGAASPLLSGLSWVGHTLEKGSGARAIKGVLAGKPREALSAIPFSDTLGITDPLDRTSGSELLHSWGAPVEKDANLLSLSGAAGLGADILLDPLTYATFGAGALTKLGKVAGKAGVKLPTGATRAAGLLKDTPELQKVAKYLSETPEALSGLKGHFGRTADDVAADIAGQSLGGNVGLSALPFGFGPQVTADIMPALRGAGQFAANLPGIGSTLGKVGTGIADAAGGLKRLGSAAFEKAVAGRTTEAGQDIFRNIAGATPGGEAAGMRAFHEVWDAGPGVAAIDPAQGVQVRRMAEGVDPIQGPLAPMAQKIKDNLQKQYLERTQYRDIQFRDDYFPRQTTPGTAPFEKGRESILDLGMPTQGQGSINEFMSSPIPPGATKQDIVNDLATRWIKPNPKLSVDEVAKRTEGLADWKMQMGEMKSDLFPRHALEDIATHHVAHGARMANDVKLHEGILDLGMSRAAAGPGAVSLKQVLTEAGLTKTVSRNQAAGSSPLDATIKAMEKKLGRPATPDQAIKELDNFFVPAKEARDILQRTDAITNPGWMKPALEGIDSATNMFKGLVTVPWPGYLTRNLASGVAHNVMLGGFDPNAAAALRYVQPIFDAIQWRKAGAIKDVDKIAGLAGKTAAEKSKNLAAEIIQWGITGKSQFEHMAQLPTPFERLKDIIPGVPKDSLAKIASDSFKGKSVKDWLNPLGVKGVGGRAVDEQPIVALGRATSTRSDELNRVALYIAKRKQGLTPEAARLDVLKAHLDYSNLSKFESSVMRRVAPFYSFFRQALPTLTKEMFERPGGPMAQAFRAVAKARGKKEGFIPEYLGDRIALPVGDEKDGTQRYLSSIGLPFEDIGQLAGSPGQYLLGQLNPFAKAPLELLTNRQFHSGRELTDLRSRTGAPTLVENLAMNSPLARLFYTGGTLADIRKDPLAKATNLLSGVKLTDVDMEQARSQAGRRALESQLRQMPHVRQGRATLYIPKSQRHLATEEERAMLQLYNRL